jgi:hypothetical protein
LTHLGYLFHTVFHDINSQSLRTPRAFCHHSSGYQANSCVYVKKDWQTVSQVADEVLFKGLIEMQELDAPV